MVYYIYMTTNLINGMRYIGKHHGEINDSYLGSGSKLKEDIKKFGKINFKKDILYISQSEEENCQKEIEFIKAFNAVESPLFYNIHIGGAGGNTTAGYSKEEKAALSKKLSIFQSGKNNGMYGKHHTEETKRKISESKKGQIPWNKGIPLSEETKKKIGNVNKGKIYVNDGVHNKLIMPDQLDEYLLNGYYKGRTQETIDKIAKANTGKKRSPESVENIIKGTLLAKQRKKEMNV